MITDTFNLILSSLFTIVDTCNKAIYIKLTFTSSECVALSRNIKDFNKNKKEKEKSLFFPFLIF